MITTKCRKCAAQIAFIMTTKGKPMPVNPEPILFMAAGGPETFVDEKGRIIRGRRDPDGYMVGYISHFATCPAADSFRRARVKQGGCNDGKTERGHH